MLKCYQSNRMEQLAAKLVGVMSQPLVAPLVPEVVITQHQGMARWLSFRLALSHGVAANIEFPFPAAFVWRVFHSQLSQVPEHSGFDREALVWRVLAELPAWLAVSGFESLKHYLSNDQDGLKLYQLSRRIADVFDQYLIYRPEWIADWERGGAHHWQARLWRALVEGRPRAAHRARLYQSFLELCAAGGLRAERLPARVMVFGISSLPPSYLEVLARISVVVDVHLFVLNPSLAFWEDIVDEKSLAKLRNRWRGLGREDVSDYYPVGNSLLASMGKQGRDYMGLLQQFALEEEVLFEAAGWETLLAHLQDDILELHERGAGADEILVIDPVDASLQVHAVHSPMREVQVLHDQMLALFERHTDLRPQDVVVMTPDIDKYAPYIEAVFGTAPAGRFIPWTVIDRSAQAEHPIVTTFLQLLGLPQSRFTASEVMSLLEIPSIARGLQLDETALERLRQWIIESGIRWGLDGGERGLLGLPDTPENTWQFGLSRLLLGFAMPPQSALYRDILPYPAIEGGEVRWLGVLQSFLARLRGFRRRLSGEYDALQWQSLVNELLSLFQVEDELEQDALQVIRDVIQGLTEHTALAEFGKIIPLVVVRDYLKGHLSEPTGGQRFLGGQMNFCAMMPMRSLPFRVVCMIGMNDRDYPRNRIPIGFDRMADDPRAGDRSRRDDDRYLFLEALLSAREYLYISYLGRNIRDNSPMLPSVLVTELLDYVEQGYRLAEGDLRKHLVMEHLLQPFSQPYFSADSRLFSYADEWLASTRVVGGRGEATPVFVDAALPVSAQVSREIALDDLLRFFRSPAEVFLRQRFGLSLRDTDTLPEDSEPFGLDNLQRYGIKNQLLDYRLQRPGAHDGLALLRAEGVLPYGAFGEQEYHADQALIEGVASRVEPLLAGRKEPLSFCLVLGEFSLTGSLVNLTSQGMVSVRCSQPSGTDYMRLWLQHLILNSITPDNVPLCSYHVSEGDDFVLPPVQQAENLLLPLLELYWQGLTRPLPFFPKSSYAYAAQIHKNGDLVMATAAARKKWFSSEYVHGEDQNLYAQLAFRGIDPLGDEFADLACRVFTPLLLCAGEDNARD